MCGVLRSAFSVGCYRAEMERVGIRDVAARAGVSVATVSFVLNSPGRVSAGATERVQQAIADLGYVRNEAARQLRMGRSSAIGLVMLDLRNPFFTDLALGAEEEAASNGLSVVLGHSDRDADRESTYLDLFEAQRLRGIVIAPFGDIEARLTTLLERGIPVVLVDWQSEDPRFGSIAVDNVTGGRLAGAHLLERGRRNIAFVGGPFIRQIRDRLEGAREALSEYTDGTLEVIETTALSFEEGRRVGRQLLDREPGRRPDAVFAANDLIAAGLLQVLAQDGSIRVPEDMSLVGFDDIAFASATTVPLTTVRQPSRYMGTEAVRMLIDAERPDFRPRNLLLLPELVVRRSTDSSRSV
jgi:LacI family transcriptional regulator